MKCTEFYPRAGLLIALLYILTQWDFIRAYCTVLEKTHGLPMAIGAVFYNHDLELKDWVVVIDFNDLFYIVLSIPSIKKL